MPGPDPTHWLHRLTADEWLSAARGELAHCEETLRRRAVRPGVTHGRRAAGMAWNAVLALAGAEDSDAQVAKFGRSYMDHVIALAGDADTPDDVRAAAVLLRETPAMPPELVTIGKSDVRVLDAARVVVAYAAERVAAMRGTAPPPPPPPVPSPGSAGEG